MSIFLPQAGGIACSASASVVSFRLDREILMKTIGGCSVPQNNPKQQTTAGKPNPPQHTQEQNQSSQDPQASGQQSQNETSQQVPPSEEPQPLSQTFDQQIQAFEQQLSDKSNSDLKELSGQLDEVERKMLLKKIDNQLQTMKTALEEPDASASTAASQNSPARGTT